MTLEKSLQCSFSLFNSIFATPWAYYAPKQDVNFILYYRKYLLTSPGISLKCFAGFNAFLMIIMRLISCQVTPVFSNSNPINSFKKKLKCELQQL